MPIMTECRRSMPAVSRSPHRHVTVIVIGVTAALMTGQPANAAPEASLWEKWTAHDATSRQTIDHSAWNDILSRYVVRTADGRNVVRYADVTDTDRAALDAYLERLTATAVSTLNRREQKAFWINLYNAGTVRLVLQHYPVASIRDIGGGLFFRGPWRDKIMRVEDTDLSLDDIEHRIVRPIWRDPLVHYALNCAASSCPDLQARAFTADNCDNLLAQAARDFINHPRGLRLDGDVLEISSIYKWYGSDFGASEADLRRHLAKYAGPRAHAALTKASTIGYQPYDWSLNDAGG